MVIYIGILCNERLGTVHFILFRKNKLGFTGCIVVTDLCVGKNTLFKCSFYSFQRLVNCYPCHINMINMSHKNKLRAHRKERIIYVYFVISS